MLSFWIAFCLLWVACAASPLSDNPVNALKLPSTCMKLDLRWYSAPSSSVSWVWVQLQSRQPCQPGCAFVCIMQWSEQNLPSRRCSTFSVAWATTLHSHYIYMHIIMYHIILGCESFYNCRTRERFNPFKHTFCKQPQGSPERMSGRATSTIAFVLHAMQTQSNILFVFLTRDRNASKDCKKVLSPSGRCIRVIRRNRIGN